MWDERAFLARVEAADAEEFRAILTDPTAEEAEVLRIYFGQEGFRRLRRQALRAAASPELSDRGIFAKAFGREAPKQRLGNVVVLPGIMGSSLSSVGSGGDVDGVWLNIPRLVVGALERLRLADDGLADFDPRYRVQATGVLKRYYGELILSLSRNWEVRTFWYDWRRNLDLAADQLRASILSWFGPGVPVHLVAHSMGGLVSRTFIERHPDVWASMWDRGDAASGRPAGTTGGRLVMLGTPNHGSYMVVQGVAGLASTSRLLERIDVTNDMDGILKIINSFVGTFQMLPSPLVDPAAKPLYEPETYDGYQATPQVLSRVLKLAKEHHERLADVIDPKRMTYVAGSNQATISGISGKISAPRLNKAESYLGTKQGDGSVTHALGMLRGVPTYFVESEHSALTSNGKVLGALDSLLLGRTPVGLAGGAASTRGTEPRESMDHRKEIAKEFEAKRARDLDKVEELIRQVQPRVPSRSKRASSVSPVVVAPNYSQAEREVQDELLRDVVRSVSRSSEERVRPPIRKIALTLRLAVGSIHDVPEASGVPAVDALAVGLYERTRPSGPVAVVDRVISQSMPGGAASRVDSPVDDLLLTQLCDRKMLRGQLGQPFLLPDPRGGNSGRHLVVVGLGPVGGCGTPELAVVVRELTWFVGRLGKRHLASVLIGSGTGNLSVREAVEAWLRGLKLALTGTQEDADRRIDALTIVEHDPERVNEIDAAIGALRKTKEICDRFDLDYQRLPARPAEIALRRREGVAVESPAGGAMRLSTSLAIDPTNPRIGIYRYAAVTTEAAIPEREVALDPTLVNDANAELLAVSELEQQEERGEFLGRLLLPSDLRQSLRSDAPMVLEVDATTARIHWEMVAQPDPIGSEREVEGGGATGDDAGDRFLGLGRGFTRQLRTSLAGPPEPPPPPRRLLRVLVVADPAGDRPLPGAEEEGLAVAELFEAFNRIAEGQSNNPNRVEVHRLIGPSEATRTAVMRRLATHTYDVLHYAGHCFFDAQRPECSGWLFHGGAVLSAYELRRIDRVPRFVFSNACESGVTPARLAHRSDRLAPSFAEAFFERGVADFVCTAWPVNDRAALEFALTLYRHLLGFVPSEESGSPDPNRLDPLRIFEAMQKARRAAAKRGDGRLTWGAYQHYGNPHFTFFDARVLRGDVTEAS